MSAPRYHPWLHRFALLTTASAWVVICFGGLVTSHGAGLAVPDWPNTYGYNLFLFPFSKWVGGIFYEHTHRLVASGAGLLTTVLAAWIWRVESRPWLRWLGLAAWVGVVLQGVLGGLRVLLLRDPLGLLHGALGQLYFLAVAGIALTTSRWWLERLPQLQPAVAPAGFRTLLWLTTLLIFGQLLLGATMRHRHAGLAVPDFPAAYGRWWPRTDPESVARYNRQRAEPRAVKPITAYDIGLHMTHRITAVLVVLGVGVCARLAGRSAPPARWLSRGCALWLALVGVQFGLGAATVWTAKSADVATAHVAVGSLVLALGAGMTLLGHRLLQGAPAVERRPQPARAVCSPRSSASPAGSQTR